MSRRRWWRATAAAALALTVTAAPALAPPAAAQPGPPLPLTVQLTTLTPLAPQPGDRLVVRGVLHDVSTGSVTNLRLALLVSRNQIGSRSAFDGYADNVDGPFPFDSFAAEPLTVHLPSTRLRPGRSEAFAVSVAIDDLHLPSTGVSWQVRALGVEVTGDTSAGTQTVGRLHTFLPWAPLGVPGVGQPTRVAWIWPLVDRPHRTAAPAWSDDDLAAELATGGRLDTLLSAGAAAQSQHAPPPARPKRRGKRRPAQPARPRPTVVPVPVTWAVDPLLVQDAQQMSAGYRVRTGGKVTTGPGTHAARSWLSRLQDATESGSVLALPYADPDIVAAVRHGLSDQVQVALSTGRRLLAHSLGGTQLDYVWPPDGLMDQHTLDTLFAGGVTTVVLADTALPVVGGPPNETPSAHTTVTARDGNLNALLVDEGLSAAVQDGADHPANAELDVQRVLAELLMIQAELPNDQRTIVLAPQRRWSPSPAYADALLADSGRVPWVDPVALSSALEAPVYTKVRREQLVYQPLPVDRPTGRRAELPRPYLADVRRLQTQLDSFAAIVPPGNEQARGFDDALLRMLSSGWRSRLDRAARTLGRLHGEVRETMAKVHIASAAGSLVTLTSHSGTVPVTVANDLDTPVRIVVRISSAAYLRVTGAGRAVRTIAAHRQVPVDVRAAAKTSGVFTLTVALYTPAPHAHPYGKPVELRVRSTAYGAAALIITGGAMAVLLVAVAIRLVRRALSARRRAGGEA